ncbi:Gfo/Idh/MocA family protein, partial [Singulisphaera rosea]
DAGKHVYVEKPCSHNIREGRLMLEAARRNKRVMQVGMQSRSSETVRQGIQLLRDGAIGDVLVAKAWNSQKRKDIGRAQPSTPPEGLDYDLWIGPAPMVPYQANRLHYNWHWWYAFGTGDMGNDGVHELDIARWGLGVEDPPATVAAIGGKYAFDDDQQFPDTQYVVFEFPGDGRVGHKKQLVFEQRIWSPYPEHGAENGNAFYGTKGMMILTKNEGWTIAGGASAKGAVSVASNHQNFLDCIRNGGTPNADIEVGHRSATLCHLG